MIGIIEDQMSSRWVLIVNMVGMVLVCIMNGFSTSRLVRYEVIFNGHMHSSCMALGIFLLLSKNLQQTPLHPLSLERTLPDGFLRNSMDPKLSVAWEQRANMFGMAVRIDLRGGVDEMLVRGEGGEGISMNIWEGG